MPRSKKTVLLDPNSPEGKADIARFQADLDAAKKADEEANDKAEALAAAAQHIKDNFVPVAMVATGAATNRLPEVFRDHESHCVCVYSRGPARTYFLGIDGTQLSTLNLSHSEFDRIYDRPLEQSALDFARSWTKDASAIAMVPISGSALRVLRSILGGQPVNTDEDATQLNPLEKHMAATEETGFRKPDGPVAKVHAHLDKHIEKIKAGTISRKQLIDGLVEKGYSAGTVTTQAGVWARNNGVTFARPQAAEGAVKEARAAKKTAAKKAPAKKAGAKKAKATEAQAAA